jgi:hypothetical protein
MIKTKHLGAVALALILFCASVFAQTQCKKQPEEAGKFTATLGLTKSFVEKYKNLALITTKLTLDRYPQSPHPIGRSGDDGDIHIAGRESVVKLPFVAEIMNPRYFQALEGDLSINFKDIFEEIGRGNDVKLTGVWRLWFEHPGKKQVMGEKVSIPKDTSPPHVFEIHPVTEFRGIDTIGSLIEIKNYKKGVTGEVKSYQAHPGSTTVPYYECLLASVLAGKLDDGKAGIMIASKKAQYNYTELSIEFTGKPKKFEDCHIALAHVYNSFEEEEQLTNKPRRLIFVDGSPPAERLSSYKKGTRIRILGIPRINLDEVSAVAKISGGVVKPLFLPYEIIVAAVLDQPED